MFRLAQIKEFFGLVLLGLLESVALFVVWPILTEYVEHYGAFYPEMGLFFTAYSLTWVLLQLYTGHLSDKYGKKRFIFVGLLIFGASAFLVGLAQTFIQLVVFRVLQGVGLGIFGPAALGLVAQFKEKGKSLAFYRTANGVGIIIGPIVGGVAGDFNLSYPFFISGLISLMAIASLHFLREEKTEITEAGFIRSIKGMLFKRNIVLVCLAAFLAELCFAALEIVIPLVGLFYGFSGFWRGVVLSSYFVAFAVLQVPVGFFSERVEKRKVVVSASFMGAIPFLILYFTNNPLEMSLSMGVLGVMLGAVFVQSSAMVAELSPKGKESLCMAFFDAVIDFSFPVMPGIVTYLVMFGIKTPFLLLISLMMFSGFTFAAIRKQGTDKTQIHANSFS